jgi:hypothetical protein
MHGVQADLKKDVIENFMTSLTSQVRNTLQIINSSLCQTSNGKKIYGSIYSTLWKISEEVENKLVVDSILDKYVRKISGNVYKLYEQLERNRVIIEAIKGELQKYNEEINETKAVLCKQGRDTALTIKAFQIEKEAAIKEKDDAIKEMEQLKQQFAKEKAELEAKLKETNEQAMMYKVKYAEKLVEQRSVVDKVKHAVEEFQKSQTR